MTEQQSQSTRILALVGGPANVQDLTHCISRLRFRLHDKALVDEARLRALPDVVTTMYRADELHVAIRSGVVQMHADIVTQL